MLSSVRLYRASGADRVCVVSTQPAFNKPGAFLIHVAKGVRVGKLGQGTAYGPYPEAELELRFNQVLESLKAQGYSETAPNQLIEDLQSDKAKTRARAAQRLGWMRSKQAVDALLAAMPKAVDDVCCLIDALGEIGDPKAIPAIRVHAERKLLSRRRSGVEALRKLKDAEGMAAARQRAVERLEEPVKKALLEIDELDPEAVGPLVSMLMGTPLKERGPALDVLYELGTPGAVAAVRAVLEQSPFTNAGMWRYTKSVLKRSMLRHDFATFGWLSHAIEAAAANTTGTTANVKSGYDGQSRPTPIFRKKTQRYVRRLAWRYLRRLAKWRPEDYAAAAAEAVVHYTPGDSTDPKGLYGSWANAHVLYRVLWGASTRFTVDGRSLKARFKSSKVTQPQPGVREEANPELWDAVPRAYLRLLAAGKILEVHALGHAGLKRHPKLMEGATPAELDGMLQAPHEQTVQLALAELSRRFDASNPDWALLETLVASDKPVAKELGLRWLKLTAHLWTRDLERLLSFLQAKDGEVRALCSELAIVALPGAEAVLRESLAEKILELLRFPEKEAGDHDRYARIATEGVGAELSKRLTTDDLMKFITEGSNAAKSIAGTLLGRRPEALAQLGIELVLALAENEVAAVRVAAVALLKGAMPQLKDDPRLLFALAESDWADTRSGAVELLKDVDLARLGLDGIVGLCDSNHVEVQDLGRELSLRHLGELEPNELLFRLSQHPHRNVQRFALDLVETHLKDGFVALAKLEHFFRTALMDVWPDRRMKRRVLTLLATRALQDENQAQMAADILNDVVRTATRGDFELAAEALVKIKLAFPQVNTAVALGQGGAA